MYHYQKFFSNMKKTLHDKYNQIYKKIVDVEKIKCKTMGKST